MCAMNNEPIDNMLTKKSMKPMMQHMNLFIDTELNRNQPNIQPINIKEIDMNKKIENQQIYKHKHMNQGVLMNSKPK